MVMRRVSFFVPNKSLSTYWVMLMKWLLEDGAWLPEEPTMCLEGWNFWFHPWLLGIGDWDNYQWPIWFNDHNIGRALRCWERDVPGEAVGGVCTTLLFICCKASSVIRSNVVWNTAMVGKVFCKAIGGGLAEALHAAQANLYPECLLQEGQNVAVSMRDWCKYNQPA